MKAAFYTFGCKVNQYETQVLSQFFEADGFLVVPFSEEADVYLINSCTVTSSGDKKTKQLVRQTKRRHPDSIVVLTGCFPQAFPDQAEEIAEADLVAGAKDRAALLSGVKQVLSGKKRVVSLSPHEAGEPFEPMRASRFDEHTRAFVKIEDGCDRWCSYCIIPKARGPVRSKPIKEIKSELSMLAQNGYKEVVLVGINLSSYGKETGSFRLAEAVEAACAIEGIERVRLGSLEPELLTDEDLRRMAAQEKFCPQFHLSLQSGCDRTLKQMNRHYTAAEYKALVNRIRAQFENPSITTDIMVGFAGETDEDFSESVRFAEEIGFAKVHVFAYSVREGTRAAKMSGHLPQSVKDVRSREMIARTDALHEAFLRTQLNRVQSVLFETQQDGLYTGYTPNYTRVFAPCSRDICGEILPVRLLSVKDGACVGEIVSDVSGYQGK